jgi:C-terminal processing protease CtpA/Prc
MLAACGGGGGGAGPDGGGGPAVDGDGSIPASSAFARKCAPDNTLARDSSGVLKTGYFSGTLEDERAWARGYMNEAYLWYREVPTVDPAAPAFNVSPAQLALDKWFEALKSPVLITADLKKDRFSFTLPTAQWNALAQSGVVGGYGIEWALASATVPRSARVAYVDAGSQAASAGVARGDAVLGLVADGVSIDFVNTVSAAEIDLINQAMFSPARGRQTTFRLRSNGGIERTVSLTASDVTTTPVKEARVLNSGGAKVGYLLFNDFILPGEAQLKLAMETFRAERVSDLILDLRYNGGGYLYMASQLAYMIAPAASTAGKTFERSVFSDKRAAASNSPSNNMQFMAGGSGLAGSGTSLNAPLPNLGLNRVYVLTTASTCSASESVINGLRGVDVEVIVIGTSTCGKPYGFTARDNCGLSYFPVEFQGVNNKGFGEFPAGFAPTCVVQDDLNNPLGAETEGLLAAALAYRGGGSCAASAAAGAPAAKDGSEAGDRRLPGGAVVRPAPRSNKFLMQ